MVFGIETGRELRLSYGEETESVYDLGIQSIHFTVTK